LPFYNVILIVLFVTDNKTCCVIIQGTSEVGSLSATRCDRIVSLSWAECFSMFN